MIKKISTSFKLYHRPFNQKNGNIRIELGADLEMHMQIGSQEQMSKVMHVIKKYRWKKANNKYTHNKNWDKFLHNNREDDISVSLQFYPF